MLSANSCLHAYDLMYCHDVMWFTDVIIAYFDILKLYIPVFNIMQITR